MLRISKMMKKFFFKVFLCCFLLSIFGCSQKNATEPVTFLALGTVCNINLFDGGTSENYSQLTALVNSLEKKLSVNLSESEISAINKLAGIKPVSVSQETFDLILFALETAQNTNGAFNPCVGSVVSLWKIGSDEPYFPTLEEGKEQLRFTDWQKITVNKKDNSVFLKEKGMQLDLGGIAKGYVADVLASECKKLGVKRAIINLGGNVLLLGEKASKEPWITGIRNPTENDVNSVIKLSTAETSVVTSGIYERYFIKDGELFHHIFDSKTGYPAKNELLSVSIITETSCLADALSTAVFVMGLENGYKFVESLPEVEAVFITKDKEVFATKNIQEKIEILDSEFSLK